MGGFIPFAGNIDTTDELVGFTLGAATTLATSGSSNTKGAWATLGGVTVADIAGFDVIIEVSSNSNGRFLIDIALGGVGSEVVLIANIPICPGTSGTSIFPFPLNIPAGTQVSARQQSNSNFTVQCGLRGVTRTAGHPPLFNNCEALTAAKTSNTTPSTVDATVVSTANTGWVALANPSARAYGALVGVVGYNQAGTLPATSQPLSLRLGTGGSGATDATRINSNPFGGSSSGVAVSRFNALVARKAIPAATRIAAEVLGATASDTYAVNAWGLY